MFKRCKVVMLPTNEKADIPKGQLYLKSNKKGNIDDSLVNSKLAIASKYLDYEDRQNIIFCAGGDVYLKSQHLYILSDDKVKEGDWCIGNNKIHAKSPDEFFVAQCTSVVNGWIYLEGHEGEGNNPDYTKKIIATTNTSLKFGEDVLGSIKYKTLPSPSQSFIEKYISEYNKGNVTTDVLVEYENAIECWKARNQFNPGSVDFIVYSLEDKEKYTGVMFDYYPIKLKVSKNNTIAIKKVKDSWTKEELVQILSEFGKDVVNKESHLPHMFELYAIDWIEQNL